MFILISQEFEYENFIFAENVHNILGVSRVVFRVDHFHGP